MQNGRGWLRTALGSDSDLGMRSREVRFTPDERTSLADMRWPEWHISFRAREVAILVTFVQTPDTRMVTKLNGTAGILGD
jgi:hypothetical protein